MLDNIPVNYKWDYIFLYTKQSKKKEAWVKFTPLSPPNHCAEPFSAQFFFENHHTFSSKIMAQTIFCKIWSAGTSNIGTSNW